MEKISVKYKNCIEEMIKRMRPSERVNKDNVYQAANQDIRPFVDQIIRELLLNESALHGFDNLETLFNKARGGASCLLLVEHYSNFDLPVFIYLLRQQGEKGQQIADSIVAIAGVKLNEENHIVAAFAEAYTRIVIAPSRTMQGLDPKEDWFDFIRAKAINRAGIKTLKDIKNSGRIILVFPSGTRFRPWDPDSAKGVREIDSYLKSFDFMCFVSIHGNILRVVPRGPMSEDLACQDRVTMRVGQIQECKNFRDATRKNSPSGEDKKQRIADEVMRHLKESHDCDNQVKGAFSGSSAGSMCEDFG